MAKEFGIRIPVKGYTTIYIKAEDKEDALNKVLEEDYEIIAEPENELDYDYKFKSDIDVWECDE
jgi:hypothetical protein